MDASLLELALTSGFLRRGAEGSLLPGPAGEIWREGALAGLAGLALNVLGALLAQIAADEETAEAFPGEHLAALFPLSAPTTCAAHIAPCIRASSSKDCAPPPVPARPHWASR